MFANSLKQGNAGLGKAIAYFTMHGYGVAIPLTDSEDWDLVVCKDRKLQKVQVKTSTQMPKNVEVFEVSVHGGNNGKLKTCKYIAEQDWDLLFLYHLTTGLTALIPKSVLSVKNKVMFGPRTKYREYLITD
jgi:hypothetical protein